jgi:ABC-2 type transport system ATP-binding protein
VSRSYPTEIAKKPGRIVTAVAAVRARGLVKRFETTTALDGVDLLVEEGEVRGLLGPNGAGKTTLLRLLFGLVAADAGDIDLFGHPLGSAESVDLDGVAGFVEEPTFYPYLPGQVNLELFAELDGGAIPGRVEEVLEIVGLSGRGGDRVSGYSTGMRQRLGIAAALLRSPRLLLLDEPTSGLDPAGARDMAGLVRRLAAEGTAVLLSSHLIGDLENVCDAYTVLRLGKVVWDGSAQQLREQAPGSAYRLATSDDARALELAEQHPTVHVTRSPTGELRLVAQDRVDAYVLDLGRADIAVRRLELVVSPLESMFFALTTDVELDEAGFSDLIEAAMAQA